MSRFPQAALALLLLALAAPALSQTYPSKSIRFIVGFPPGGSADPTTRLVGQALSEQLGQPVVVENRPGADSAIAAEMITRLPADGYTLFFGSNSAMTAAVALKKSPAYDPLKDFTPISLVGRATVFLYVHPSVPAATLKEFVEHARAHPGKLNYGTGNPLSILYNVQLMSATGVSMVHVPYKGEGPLNPDIFKDFTPISLVGRATVFLYVHPSVPAATLKEFVEHARAHPGKLNYGTGNPLSILYNVQLMSATGVSMVHVPYKGEGPLNPDILAGRVQSGFLSTSTALSHGKD